MRGDFLKDKEIIILDEIKSRQLRKFRKDMYVSADDFSHHNNLSIGTSTVLRTERDFYSIYVNSFIEYLKPLGYQLALLRDGEVFNTNLNIKDICVKLEIDKEQAFDLLDISPASFSNDIWGGKINRLVRTLDYIAFSLGLELAIVKNKHL